MTDATLNRRRLLQAGLGAAALPTLAQATDRLDRNPRLKRTLDLDKPEDALTAMVKMRASLEATDSPHWYFGTIYAVLPGKAPIPMVDYEGSEIDYYERQEDGSYGSRQRVRLTRRSNPPIASSARTVGSGMVPPIPP